MRFRLRTLMILLAIGPPVLAFTCLNMETVGIFAIIFALWFAYVSAVIVLTASPKQDRP